MFSSRPRRSLVRIAVAMVSVALVVASLPWKIQAASGDKTLKHISGDTGYSATDSGSVTPVTGSQDLPDTAYVVTKNGGVADIVLRDSSVIRIAQDAKIKVTEFNAAESGRENIVTCYSGAYRFHIEHPAGGQSNYRFVTPTSQIAVRGTDGVVVIDPDNTTRVSTTEASTPNDVRVAANPQGVNLTLYRPPLQAPFADALAIRAFDQDDLPPMAPDYALIHPSAPVEVAQIPPFPVVFTVVAPGTTAVVTVTGLVSVVNGVITLTVLSGTLSTVTAARYGRGRRHRRYRCRGCRCLDRSRCRRRGSRGGCRRVIEQGQARPEPVGSTDRRFRLLRRTFASRRLRASPSSSPIPSGLDANRFADGNRNGYADGEPDCNRDTDPTAGADPLLYCECEYHDHLEAAPDDASAKRTVDSAAGYAAPLG